MPQICDNGPLRDMERSSMKVRYLIAVVLAEFSRLPFVLLHMACPRAIPAYRVYRL